MQISTSWTLSTVYHRALPRVVRYPSSRSWTEVKRLSISQLLYVLYQRFGVSNWRWERYLESDSILEATVVNHKVAALLSLPKADPLLTQC